MLYVFAVFCPTESAFFVLDASKTRRTQHPAGSVLAVRDQGARKLNALLRHSLKVHFRLRCKQDKERAAFPTGVYKTYTSKGKRKRDEVLRRI